MLRPSTRALERWALAAAFAATWPVEIVLAERKYGMLGGGFGQSHALSGPEEVGGFLIVTALAQSLLLLLLYLLSRLWRDPARREERLVAFLFTAVGLCWLVLAARLELLRYFSDAVSFQLLRNLGGGSLVDAALFGLSEGSLYLVAIGAALAAFLVLRALLRRRARNRPIAATAPALAGRGTAVLAALAVAGVLSADRARDVRLAAQHVTAYALLSKAVATATDIDRDGYGWAGAEIDRQPLDPARYPFALDVPGDGIDQDGLAGDFTTPALPTPRAATSPSPGRPRHLVLVVLESTRADVIGKRVDGRLVAPNLSALAASGSWAREAYSHVGFTTASLKSLFTGSLAPPTPSPSLFRDLKRAGYRIGVFSGQPEGFGDIDTAVGERATADVFVDAETLKDERAGAFAAQGSLLVDEGKLLGAFDRTFGSAAGWKGATFAYFNFQSAHFPYHHDGMADLIDTHPLPRGEITLENRARVERTYWNAVAYADARLGALIGRLKRLDAWQDTLLVVTADHGESLFDDRFLGHGHLINRQQTQVPLVVNRAGVRLDGPIGLAEYRALILALLDGGPVPPSENAVFQYIGTLDRPAQIGIVEHGGRWTVYDLDTGDVRFTPGGPARPYTALPPADRARADRLIRRWEGERWRATRLGGS